MKLITAILALSSSTRANAQQVITVEGTTGVSSLPSNTLPASILALSVPDYSTTQCDQWLARAQAADSDGTGGLSADEYHSFLVSIEEPAHVASYFEGSSSYLDLDWSFKITHKALACQCVNLGMGNGCCKGDSAEIPISVVMGAGGDSAAAKEFRADICNSVAAVFEKAIPSPAASPVAVVDVTTTTVATTTTEATTAAAAEEATTAAATTEAADETTAAATTAAAATEAAAATTADATTAAATTAAPETAEAATTTPPPAGGANKGVVLSITGSTIDYSSFDYSKMFDGGIPDDMPEFSNAVDVMENVGENNVLAHVIKGFGSLGNELLSGLPEVSAPGKRRGLLRGAGLKKSGRELNGLSLKPVKVTDVACPTGLEYAPKDTFCLNFAIEFANDNGALSEDQVITFSNQLQNAIDMEGSLYDIILRDYPDTNITGLGSPGKGIDYTATANRANAETVSSLNEPAEDEGGSLGTAAIIFIILAVMFVPIAIVAMYSRYKKVQNEERLQRLEEYDASRHSKNHTNDLEAGPAEEITTSRSANGYLPAVVSEGDDEDSIWSENEDGTPKATSGAGSSLAAMGAAGLGASMVNRNTDDMSDDAIRAEVEQLVKETDAPKSADELLTAYAGREGELVTHLRKMKVKKDKDADVRAEVQKLAKETNAPKSADDMLASYKGREEELLKNLRKMKARQQTHEEKAAIRTEVEQLVEVTNTPKSADELLETYEGREDVLISNLKKMKAKQDGDAGTIAEIRTLAEETNAPKSADEMLASYAGREDELLKNLRKMKKKMDKDAEETDAPKGVDEMLAAKMKAKREIAGDKAAVKAEVEQLVKDTNSPKTADELLAMYEGRETELVKNLQRMKTKQADEKKEDEGLAAIRAEVATLAAETNAPKSADDMLASYKGREEELLKNLRKMKTKQDKAAAKASANADDVLTAAQEAELTAASEKAAIVAEVTALVDAVTPGKSAEEMLNAYEGKEEDLLKNLRKMKAKQDKAAVKASAAAAPAPAAAPAAPEASAAMKAEVAALVEKTKPGKSAEDLLLAYKGREDELIAHLKKLKTSKRDV